MRKMGQKWWVGLVVFGAMCSLVSAADLPQVDVIAISNAYKENMFAADQMYKGKRFIALGTLLKIDKHDQGGPLLQLSGRSAGQGFVVAILPATVNPDVAKLQRFERVALNCQGSGAQQAVPLLSCATIQPAVDLLPAAVKRTAPEVQRLISRADAENGKCRGGVGGTPATDAACKRRDEAGQQLKQLGWCWGPSSASGFEQKWIECRFDL